ncbi:unnamed protein product [Spodoptera littoralis]|uniref:Secreted protein n=1 Tax=Spodoptera littoralis TaxID=7109 RepID=A0A9P0IKB6_SPOLI|nr:unnamed protein product [Spodoptera littoralis]
MCTTVWLSFVLCASGIYSSEQNTRRWTDREVYSFTTTHRPLIARWRTTTPRPKWVYSYFLFDDDYPLFGPRPFRFSHPVAQASEILWSQMIPLLKNMVIGAKDFSIIRGIDYVNNPPKYTTTTKKYGR